VIAHPKLPKTMAPTSARWGVLLLK